MLPTTLDDVLVRVRARLEQDDVSGAVALVEALRPPDQADLFAELDPAAQTTLLPKLDPGDSADILEELEDDAAARLIDGLSDAERARIVDEMEPDEAADLLAELNQAQVDAILSRLEDPNEVRPLLVHPKDSAGGLMTSSHLALRRRMTVADALATIRTLKPDSEEIYHLFVVDQHGRLCGDITFRQLVMADAHALLGDVMNPEVISVPVGVDQEEVAHLVARYDLLALPVVDEIGLLMGVITVDDVIDVLVEEATEDIQRLGATEPLDKPYLESTPLTVFRKRIGWLLLLFVTETLTGTVLRHFEAALSTVVSLAFFIPLLIGTGGNAGSQTTSTIIRALALGEMDKKNLLKPLWHELKVGFILGLGMGIVAYVRALLWHTGSGVALTVSLTIFVIVLWANVLGAVLPLLAHKLKIDPTVVSGPAMTTLVDATGLFIYFTVAGIVLSL
ncbi:MAG: magnesium transporter [Anaerolineae bacterium]|nr:magnesium transporter [Anaerolineae bacterium]